MTKIKGRESKGKRRGRGYGSGKGGHNSGYGTKGQKARQGRKPNNWFEGGQTPLVRRLPYINGFTSKNAYKILELNLNNIEKISEKLNAKELKVDLLKNLGLDEFDFVKVLGRGTIKSKVVLSGFWYSKKAKEKIEKVGGSIN